METLFIYLIKSGGLLAAFFLAYCLLLRKETFFNSNRWFLLLGLVASLLLPLVTFRKVVWVDPVPQTVWNDVPMVAAPVIEGFQIDWFIVIALVYAIGIFIFFLKFIFDFGNLVKTLKGQEVKQQEDFKFIDVNHNVSPFSYFNYIVYNSSLYSASELENILEHEKVHCEQKHSADVLIARLFCILFWFNPFAWLYKKVMLQNLEFIADSEALKNISDKKAYQITLLKVTTHENCVEITNHFYQSLIKKRIIMLNKNQSKKWNSWKYALIIPVLAAFMFYFQVKVIAQEKETQEVAQTTTKRGVDVVINKNTSDAQLNAYTTEFKARHDVKLKFSKVKRNSSGEIIAIKAQYTDKNGKSGTYQVSADEPIKNVSISLYESGAIAFGNSNRIHVIRNHDGEETEAISETHSDDDDDDAYSYSFEMPEPPVPPEPLSPQDIENIKNSCVVKTVTNANGKVVVSVNGEIIDVDTDKILADIDIDEITRNAKVQAEVAIRQMEAARPQMEKARIRMKEAQGNSEEMREEMEEARRQMDESRKEMEQARRELQESKMQLEESKKEFERQKAQMKAKSSKASK